MQCSCTLICRALAHKRTWENEARPYIAATIDPAMVSIVGKAWPSLVSLGDRQRRRRLYDGTQALASREEHAAATQLHLPQSATHSLKAPLLTLNRVSFSSSPAAAF